MNAGVPPSYAGGMALPTLERAVWAAPMAGGVSAPSLVVAVGRAGGLGQLAAGYLAPDALEANVREVEAAGVVFGVNVFVADALDEVSEASAVAAYRRRLEPLADELGAPLPQPDWTDTDHYRAKLDLLARLAPPVVSFTFGCPEVDDVRRLQEAGSAVVVTVTTAEEARAAGEVVPDALCVQGSEAGGHRGVWDRRAAPSSTPLVELLQEVRSVSDLPLAGAGGIMSADHAATVLEAGAIAVQAGTAFLLAHEAGTRPAHRRALGEAHRGSTVTRAFSGRLGRGLTNTWTETFTDAPATFPVVDQLTKPLRARAGALDDAEHLNLWAGTGWRDARPGAAAEILRQLDPGTSRR